jgi:Methylamine utilisation protein MauE
MLALFVQALLGSLFATSAGAKLVRFNGFRTALRGYEVVPKRLEVSVAATVPALEVAVAIGILVGRDVPIAELAAAFLLTSFTVVAGYALIRKKRIDCGCLGALVRTRLGWGTVCLNVALLGVALAASASLTPLSPFAPAELAAKTTIIIWSCAAMVIALYWVIAYARSVADLIDEAIAERVEREA